MNKPSSERQGNDTNLLSSDDELVMLVAAAMDEIRNEETLSDRPLDSGRWKTWRAH